MVKQLPPSRGIVPQSKPTLATRTPEQERKQVLAEYLEKYAAIANRALTPQLIQIYEEALEDIPVNRMKAGLLSWLKNGDRFPWPSNIREESEI